MDNFNLKDHLPWDAIGPLLFIIIAGGLCFLLPDDNVSEGIFLVIGAALTRVRRVPANNDKK